MSPAERRRRESVDADLEVVFYMPWIAPLLAPGAELPTGGAETQVFLVAKALAQAGHRVGLVVVPGAIPVPEAVDGIAVIPLPTQRRPGTLRNRAGTLLALGRILRRTRPKVVVQRAAGWTTGTTAALARVVGADFVYSSANVIDFDYGRLERRRVAIALFHAGIRLSETIVVQSAEQQALCHDRFGRRPIVVHSMAESRPPRTGVPRAFLWVGRAAAYKRPLDFVALAEALPEARFEMVAVGAEDDALMRGVRQRAARLANLEVLQPRPRHELTDVIERAVAMVNTAEFEGMPNVFLESWAQGVPALALRHDPDGVIAREGLGMYAGGDFALMVRQARTLWETRQDQATLAERCRTYVRAHHSPDVIVRGWEDALGLTRRTRDDDVRVGAAARD